MRVYLPIAIILTVFLAGRAYYHVSLWRASQERINFDKVEERERAKIAKRALYYIPLGLVWFVSVPAALLVGAYRLIRKINTSIK